MNKPRLSSEEIKRELNRPLIRNTQAITALTDPPEETIMVVSIDKLRPYEDNPRKTLNPLYDEIKASIKARGLDQTPTITKRPQEDFYIIANGGNTRLAVLNELYKETGDTRFSRIHCLFKPWQDELKVLYGHIVENEIRGNLTFIEKALAATRLKTQHEKAGGETLSLRQLAETMGQNGYTISASHLSRMLECVDSLFPAIPNTLMAGLGKPKVEALLQLKRYIYNIWNKYEPIDENNFIVIWRTLLQQFDVGPERLNIDKIKDEILNEVSKLLRQDYLSLHMDLSLLYQNKAIDDSAEDIAQPTADLFAVLDTEPEAVSTIPSAKVAKPVLSVVPLVPPANTPNTPQELTDEQREARIKSQEVSPSAKTERVASIEKQLAELDGETLPDFKASALKSIPVMAGGGLHEVSDIWSIAAHSDNPDTLREHIGLLAQDIAEAAQVKGVVLSEEGLGFGLSELIHDSSPLARSVALLLSTLLRLQASATEESSALMSALFGQVLIGSYDLPIGEQAPVSTGLAPLPDALLVKLFRIIRLARRLVELAREENDLIKGARRMNTSLTAAKINPLNQVLITHVLNEARYGHYHYCRALGFTEDIVSRLQNLTPSALTHLTHSQALWIKPQLDKGLFNRLMEHIEQEEMRNQLVNRALSLGASCPMLRHFFGLSPQAAAVHRRALGLSYNDRGRPKELSESEKLSTWRRWMELVRGVDKETNEPTQTKKASSQNRHGEHLDGLTQLDLMMLIAEEQALPLASIWNEIDQRLHLSEQANKQPKLTSQKRLTPANPQNKEPPVFNRSEKRHYRVHAAAQLPASLSLL